MCRKKLQKVIESSSEKLRYTYQHISFDVTSSNHCSDALKLLTNNVSTELRRAHLCEPLCRRIFALSLSSQLPQVSFSKTSTAR